MSTVSSKTVLVVCSPLFVEVAVRLARDFAKVFLFTPGSKTTFPVPAVGRVGFGMEGIECVDDVFGKHFESVDLFVFPDLNHAALQIYLEGIGKRVFGARNGEEMETYREVCKEQMERLGLPVAPWQLIRGMEKLRYHLQAHDNQHVKVDKWRGLFETFYAENYDLACPKLDDIAQQLGAFQSDTDFIVEDDLPDCVEVGLDAYCIDGAYPSSTLVGIEVKDLGYLGQFKKWSAIPEPLTRWTTAMAPLLGQYGYRGFLSNELRIGADLKPYMIDACCRAGSPPSELYQEFYRNISEIIWQGADGVMVDPEPAGKFGMEVIMKSGWAESHWQPVNIDPAVRHLVKLFNPVRVDGKFYVVPQDDEMSEIGAIIGYGDTPQRAMDMVKEAAAGVSGIGIKIPDGSLDDAMEQAQELTDMGLPVFDIERTKEPA